MCHDNSHIWREVSASIQVYVSHGAIGFVSTNYCIDSYQVMVFTQHEITYIFVVQAQG